MRKTKITSRAAFALLLSVSAFAQQATITHIIYLIKENRSFDHYFGAYAGVQSYCQGGHSPANTMCIAPNDANHQCTVGDTCPQPACSSASSSSVCTGTGIARAKIGSESGPYALYLENATTTYNDIPHDHLSLIEDQDLGAMDKFSTLGCPASGGSPTAHPCAYAYFDSSQIPIYWGYANTYGLEDNFFSAQTPSMPGHLYIVAGSSHGIADNPSLADGAEACLGGANVGQNCTTNAQCPGSTCTNAWNSGWSCGASHSNGPPPFTYNGNPNNVTTSSKLYCSTSAPGSGLTNNIACAKNSDCTESPYLYCTGTNYWAGVCDGSRTTACTCYGPSGDVYSTAPARCTDTASCGTKISTCDIGTSSIGGSTGGMCPTLTTIADQMNLAKVSWQYYSSSPVWNPMGYVANIRLSPYFASNAASGENQFALEAANVGGWCSGNHSLACGADSTCSAAKVGTCVDNSATKLPQISFVSPGTENPEASEHPAHSDIHSGELWSQSQVNAVLGNCLGTDPTAPNCYLYNHSIVFIVWDDSGGFWDHIYPPMEDGLNLGNRVPLLCIGPYCVHTITHLQMEFSSVLKCMESIFSIPAIGTRDVSANDACFGTGTKSHPGTGANAGMLNLSQAPIYPSASPTKTEASAKSRDE